MAGYAASSRPQKKTSLSWRARKRSGNSAGIEQNISKAGAWPGATAACTLNADKTMNLTIYLVNYLGTALVAGVLGGLAMEWTMWLISRAGLARGDMILALGSLLTKSRDNAYRVGLVVHATAAVGFAFVYTLLMVTLGYTDMPQSLMLGLAVGTLHGIIVSLMLVWVVSDHHPLAEFKEADLLIGLSHFIGHVAYGAVVGAVAGLSPLL
jgi:hypothetical protein